MLGYPPQGSKLERRFFSTPSPSTLNDQVKEIRASEIDVTVTLLNVTPTLNPWGGEPCEEIIYVSK